jgi:1,2-diacylglycerol 3-alpha-glucosyltransferase/glucuronosyltransferase
VARLAIPEAWSALQMSRQACRDFSLTRSWQNSARQFIGHINRVVIGDSRKPRAA